MSKLKTRTRVGPGGMISVSVPPELANENADVQNTIESIPPTQVDREEWLAFIQETAGSIKDPTFVRHPQGELLERTLIQ